MRKSLSTTEHATRLRALYRSDALYRQSQIEKAKQKHRENYIKKPKIHEYIVDNISYVKIPKFAEIANLPVGVVRRLLKDGIIKARKVMRSNKHKLLLKSDAILIANNLHRFIVNPAFKNIEKYDRLRLKRFLMDNCELDENKNI